MKVLNYKLFLEAELNLGELSKEKDGQKRGDVLVNKLKSGSEITLNNNRGVVVDKMKDDEGWNEPSEVVDNEITTDGSYDEDKAKKYFTQGTRYKNVFKEKDGSEFKLNQFKKTTDFGSSGPGMKTNLVEALQCLFIGIKQIVPDEPMSLASTRILFRKYLDAAKSKVYIKNPDIFDEYLFDEFADSKNWLASFYRVPNRLFSSQYNHVDRTKTYKIYHTSYTGQDSPCVKIKAKYKQISILNKFSEIDFHKFCPADAYLISQQHQPQILRTVETITTIDELTKYLDSQFDEKTLIPISLKMIGYQKPFKIITNKEIDKKLPDFFVKYFTIAEDMRGIGSKISTRSFWKHLKNKDVDVKDRNISIDSSDTSKKVNIDAEIEGTHSRHGKISFNSLKRMISQYPGLSELQSYDKLQQFDLDELRQKVKNLKYEIEQQALASINQNILVVVPFKRGKDISDSKNKLISRIQSMQVVLALIQIHTIDPNECDRLVTKIMRFALSIETDKFSTPRYLRVI